MRVWALCVVLMVALAGCSKSGGDAPPDEVQETPEPAVPEKTPTEATGGAPQLVWDTHEYLFSVGATAGTGQAAVRTTSSHPAELVDVPADATFVRVEFQWEGLAVPGATLTLAIGTGTVATLDRVLDVTVGERELVRMDFAEGDWDADFIATIAAEDQGSIVGEGTVEVRSTWFKGGVPEDDWSAFDG